MTILKSLIVCRAEWGKDKGRLSGKIQFESEFGETHMNLSEELSQRIVELCADELVKSARHIADNMSREVLATKALPAE